MQIIIFSHSNFSDSRSMQLYAAMLAEGMRSKNYEVKIWTPAEVFHKVPISGALKKWLGYIDSLIIFPVRIKKKIKECPPNTLFVFSDQALGPWIHLVKSRPHVVHCHDFMALKSALGFIEENPVSWSGKIYQNLIRKGFMQGQNFISVSKNTQQDLYKFLSRKPAASQVVYNQIANLFKRKDKVSARRSLGNYIEKATGSQPNLSNGFILHVGADVWYKNKRGVLELYLEWRKISQKDLPLVMVGKPGKKLTPFIEKSNLNGNLIVLENIPREILVDAYSAASVLIFPSLEEGFGWPIAEAMACGCPVITTNLAPMTEVGGNAAYYIDRRPPQENDLSSWGKKGAMVMEDVLNLDPKELETVIESGLKNVEKFQGAEIVDQTEAFYKKILDIKLL